MNHNAGLARNGLVAVLGSLCVVGLLVWLSMATHRGQSAESLFLYCAAGMQPPVDEAIRDYLNELGIDVNIQYGGSGTLLNNLRVAKTGDLFLAADQTTIDQARQFGVIDEVIPLARIHPVIAVKQGNPKQIKSLDDLLRADVSFALANPGAAIGSVTKALLEKAGRYADFEKKVAVSTGTVNDAATKVSVNSVDAAVVWDTTVRQYADLEAVEDGLLSPAVQVISIAVLRTCQAPAQALRFARYLQAPEKGLAHFKKHGYEVVDGDQWEATPALRIYSGGLNRVAIEQTIEDFKVREGVEVDVKYNGCGLLVNMMKAGETPDVYFACDTTYMAEVNDRFDQPRTISETDMVIVTQQGNPHKTKALSDLAQPDLRVGAAHVYNSALGKLTRDLLESVGLYEQIKPNIKVDPATADFLVNQMRAGALDAAIVYRANVAHPDVKANLDVVDIRQGRPKAVQPIAVAKTSRHKYLAQRFVDAIADERSHKRFEQFQFRWLVEPQPPGAD